jgi:hypothetical protein
VKVAAAAKRAAEGERNAAARRLAELGAAARSAKAESERLGAARQKAEAARDRTWPAGRAGGAAAAGRGHADRRGAVHRRSATRSPRWCRRPGRTRWRYGSPSVPPRSVSRPSPAAPIRWCARRTRSARPGSGPRPAAPHVPAARRSPRPSRSAPPRARRVAVSLAAAAEVRDELAHARTLREAELAGGTGHRQAPGRRAGAAHQRGAPRRGGPGRAADAHRAARGEGRRGLLAGRRHADQPSTARISGCRRPRPRSPRRRRPASSARAGAVPPAHPGEAGQQGRTRLACWAR